MKKVNVGLVGLGIVGGGVARLLMEKLGQLSLLAGCDLRLTRAADLRPDLAGEYGIPEEIFTTDGMSVVNDPDIDIIVELVGGTGFAKDVILKALANKKHVATANKALLANYGGEIFPAAQENKVSLAFEAAVGGGIPLIRSLREGLNANQVGSAMGILNGTCNYILSRMTAEGEEFSEVLADAQARGYAEADPTFDIEGIDASHKLSIITALLTGSQPVLGDIPVEGITKITPLDIRYAGEFGYRVKLLAIMRNQGGKVEARVHPALVKKDHVLATVEGAFNALHINGDWVGDVLLYGLGAGRSATASAVVADIVDLARDIVNGCGGRVPPLGRPMSEENLALLPMAEVVSQYYFRFVTVDQPGVLAAISRVLCDNEISIEAVIQKGRAADEGPVSIVMMTHEAKEEDVAKALKAIDELKVTVEPTLMIRKA